MVAVTPKSASVSNQIVLFACLVVTGLSQSIMYAVVPPLGRQMGLSDIQISSIATIGALCFVLTAPWLGGLSERFGRVPFLRAGVAAAAIVDLAFALVISARLDGLMSGDAAYGILLTLRIALNLCWGGLFPAATAYVSDTTLPEQRTAGLALVGTALSLGAIGGPAIAWLFAPLGPVVPQCVVGGLSTLALVALWLSIREPARIRPPTSEITQNRSDRPGLFATLLPHLAITTLTMLCLGIAQQLTAFRIEDLLHLSHEEAIRYAGGALSVMGVGLAVTQAVLARNSRSWAPLWLVRVGGLISLLGMIAFGCAGNLPDNLSYPAHALALGIFGVGLGVLLPGNASAVTLAVNQTNQGRAAGLLMAARSTGLVVGPVLGASLYQSLPVAPFVLACVLLIGVCITAWLMPSGEHQNIQSRRGIEDT